MTLDRELMRLVFAPFSRSDSIARMEKLVERYQHALAENVNRVRLMMEHPSALLELEALARPELEARSEAARVELANLRAAAPLPPPPERPERALTLAFADLEYFMREMRLIRRMLRKVPPIPLVEHYVKTKDPLEPIDPELVRAIGRIQRGTLLRTCAQLSALRHGTGDLRVLLAPPKEKGPPPAAVFACKTSALREGCGVKVEAFGRNIAVFKYEQKLYAIDDVCPHRGGPLHQGDVEKGAAICPLHGWAFDLATGAMRGNPRVRVPIYELETKGDDVFVGPEKK